MSAATAFIRTLREALGGLDTQPWRAPLPSNRPRVSKAVPKTRKLEENGSEPGSEIEDEWAINSLESKLGRILREARVKRKPSARGRKRKRLGVSRGKRKIAVSKEPVVSKSLSSSSKAPAPPDVLPKSSSSSSTIPDPPVPVVKEAVAQQWGRAKWKLSRLKKGGFGATCLCHTNIANQYKCKKEISRHGYTNDECRVLCKQWLLEGLALLDTDPCGQSSHVHDYDVGRLLPIRNEADLDARAATLK